MASGREADASLLLVMRDKTRDELIGAGDTIVAIATPEGRSGIGVVRVSGPRAFELVDRFFSTRDRYAPRRARFGRFSRPDGTHLDHALVTVFERPNSYTGEDVAEVGTHGNPLILKEIEAQLIAAGCRPARRGEFTLRAVANGKMDLTQAEAVRDFIDAETTAQARVAMRQLEGALSRRVRPWRDALVALVAEMEAGIDFAEDEVEPPASSRASEEIDALRSEVEALAASFGYGRILAKGLMVAIAGLPNVGKSSLFNRLVAYDRAIVTDVPGTTRDVVTETIAIAGVPLRVADTAGLRKTEETVEALGVERSLETVADADLTVLVLDGSRPLAEGDRDLLVRCAQVPFIVVVNKDDLPRAWEEPGLSHAIPVSARTGSGIDALESAIESWIVERRPETSDGFVLTSARQRDALLETAGGLERAVRALESAVPHELVLVDLYAALSALGEVTGEVTNEDILKQIFSTFCIGK